MSLSHDGSTPLVRDTHTPWFHCIKTLLIPDLLFRMRTFTVYSTVFKSRRKTL